MKFNYALEKKKFEETCETLMQEYKDAGMSDENIKEMMEYDWKWFKKERSFCRFNQHMPEEEYKDGSNPLIVKFEESFMKEDEYFIQGRYDWIEQLENEKLVDSIRSLKHEQIEILTQFVYEGKTQESIAEKLGITRSSVADRISVIKKKIKKSIK